MLQSLSCGDPFTREVPVIIRADVVGRRQTADLAWRRFLLPSAFCLLPSAFCLLLSYSGFAATQKVIVIGFDGADAHYTEQWMNDGKLPNMAKLRAAGTFRPLRPTVPAQTPVSWSTFSTGIDPGRTGIFDFLRRDPKTYLPIFAAFD